MTRRGFTIVELVITITVMGILLLLAVVNVGSTQASARDDERVADIEAISNALERYYKTGVNGATVVNTYPTTAAVASIDLIKQNLLDIDIKSFQAPGLTDLNSTSLVNATNGVQVGANSPQPTITQYIYQPLRTDGYLCASGTDCRKFNLYYRLEDSATIYKVMSKNQ